MCELMYSTAAVAASPTDELFVAMPSSSVITARGTRIIQQRLLTREAKMGNEERSTLVSMTKTIYPSTTRREVSFDGLVLGTRRERGRALDTGAEEGVFPERKRRGSSRRFDFSA